MELVNKEELGSFLRILFEDLVPAEDEYVEIIYDRNNNLNYSRAFHKPIGKSIDELIESLSAAIEGISLEGDNCAIIPMSVFKTESTLGKRSGEKVARRGCVWILEIEPKKQDKLNYLKQGLIPLDENKPESKKLIEKLVLPVLEELPEEIRKAVHSLYITGGGVNLIIKFSRPVSLEESKRLSNLFKKIIKEMLERNPELCIDESSAKIFHPQRVVGTRNYKYKGYMVHFLKRDEFISEPFEALDVDALIMESGVKKSAENKDISLEDSLEELEKVTFGSVSQPRQRYQIEEILRQADIPALFPEVKVAKDSINYYICHCPFHPPDNNPSFVIYKNKDKDGIQIAIDYHTGEIYNAIKLAQELYGYDFKEAVKWLAEALDITPEKVEHLVKERKKQEQKKVEKELSTKDFAQLIAEWLESVGIDINSVRIIVDTDSWHKSLVEVTAKDFMGNQRTLLFNFSDFRNFKVFGQKLVSLLGHSSVFPQVNKKQEQDFLYELFFMFVENAYVNGRYSEVGIDENTILSIISTDISERGNALLTLPELQFMGRGVAKSGDKYYIAAATLYEIFSKNRYLGVRTLQEIESLLSRLGIGEITNLGIHKVFVFDKDQLQVVSPEERRELIKKALEGEEIVDISAGKAEKTTAEAQEAELEEIDLTDSQEETVQAAGEVAQAEDDLFEDDRNDELSLADVEDDDIADLIDF